MALVTINNVTMCIRHETMTSAPVTVNNVFDPWTTNLNPLYCFHIVLQVKVYLIVITMFATTCNLYIVFYVFGSICYICYSSLVKKNFWKFFQMGCNKCNKCNKVCCDHGWSCLCLCYTSHDFCYSCYTSIYKMNNMNISCLPGADKKFAKSLLYTIQV